jgi:hypothetical protein
MNLTKSAKYYAYLFVFFVASVFVPEMTVAGLVVSVAILALPVMLALWQQGVVRRLLQVTQFQPARTLHWLASRRVIGNVLVACVSLLLTGLVLLQSVLFDDVDWLLLFLAPVAYLLVHKWILNRTQEQFAHQIYATHWSHRSTRWTLIIGLGLIWVALSVRSSPPSAQSLQLAEAVYQLQQQWAQSPSGLTRWMLDLGAWGKASIRMVENLPETSEWKFVITILIAPVTVLGFLGLSFNGLSFDRVDLRRVFGAELNVSDEPVPVGIWQIALWTASGAIAVSLLVIGLSSIDKRLTGAKSAFALETVPECEKIGAGVYKVSTTDAIADLWKNMDVQLGAQHKNACGKLSDIRTAAEPGVEKYLNWYFTLGAEWKRVAATFTGSADEILAQKFEEMVMTDARIRDAIAGLTAQHTTETALISATQERVQAILKVNLIVLSEAQCKIVKSHPLTLVTDKYSRHTERIAASATAGLLVGGFAAKATYRLLAKTSMKSASKVLAKALGKNLSKTGAALGGAAAGAAMGSVVPGIGTAIGAAVGAGVGLVSAVTFDFGALVIEEKLTREQMKQDLLAAIIETTEPARQTLGCKD